MSQQGTPIEFKDIQIGDMVRFTRTINPNEGTTVEITVEEGNMSSYHQGYVLLMGWGDIMESFWDAELLDRPVKLPTGEGALLVAPNTYRTPAILRDGTWYFVDRKGGTVKATYPETLMGSLNYKIVYEGRTE